MINKEYFNQVKLLVQILPEIAKEKCFVLKGGTAINLFYNNLPRLSVDIDLTYINFDKREIAYPKINSALERINLNLNKRGFKSFIRGENEKKIICNNNFSTVKIEPNYTLRGCINTPQILSVCEKAEELFGYAELPILSKQEVYGGKICAALDRQHPRDLFDIFQLIENNELNSEIIKGFVVMLLSANRPINEIINPNILDKKITFDTEFNGMSDIDFTYNQHLETLDYLINNVQTKLQRDYKEILLNFVNLNLDLSDIGIPNIEKLSAIQWKLQNLTKLKNKNLDKFNEEYSKLKQVLTK